ncbi:hypothetical protein ERJ75_000480400 [Trypanosoma vivax]|nr:hypothetical protein ERJ75_000480400 [Trypanosoma vivax]
MPHGGIAQHWCNPVRSGWMLDMQQRLGCVVNRPIHRGSVVKFIAGIRNDLVPGLRKKPHGAGDLMPPNRILERLEEMVHDAELAFEGL